MVDWVDLFIRPVYCDILDESLNYCIKEKGLSVHAYVYMSSHIHLIVTAPDGELQNIVRDFKKFTSKKLIEAIKEYPESRREWLLRKFSFEGITTGRAKKLQTLARWFSSCYIVYVRENRTENKIHTL